MKSKLLRPLYLIALVILVNFGIKYIAREAGRQDALSEAQVQSQKEGAPEGFGNAKWLMSKAQVERLFPDAIEFGNGALVVTTEEYGRQAKVGLEFQNNLFIMCVINFIQGNTNEETFKQTQLELEKEFGEFVSLRKAQYSLCSQKKFSRITVQHQLSTANGLPFEQILIYRTKAN